MKTKKELEKEILTITLKIHEEYPELSQFIEERPLELAKGITEPPGAAKLKEYLDSLKEMIQTYSKTHSSENKQEKKELPDSLVYPPSDDIYAKGIKESQLNPENINKKKTPNQELGARNEKDFSEDKSGDDLDVPGAELDDKQERIGSEDEENNYYSLGGDNHNDLDENQS
jgi:hypothetical protein